MTKEEAEKICVGDIILLYTKKERPSISESFSGQELEVLSTDSLLHNHRTVLVECSRVTTFGTLISAFNRPKGLSPEYDGKQFCYCYIHFIEKIVRKANGSSIQEKESSPLPKVSGMESDEPNPNNPFGWSDQKLRDMKFFGWKPE